MGLYQLGAVSCDQLSVMIPDQLKSVDISIIGAVLAYICGSKYRSIA